MKTYSWNRNELLRRLNNQVIRVYTTSTISIIILIISTILSVMFIGKGYSIVLGIIALVLCLNYRRVLNDAKINIGIIYLNKKSECRKLAFFKVGSEDDIKCILGNINLELVKNMIDRKANDRNLNGRSV